MTDPNDEPPIHCAHCDEGGHDCNATPCRDCGGLGPDGCFCWERDERLR